MSGYAAGAEGKVLLKKGKTLFDYVGALPSLGLSIEELRERAFWSANDGDSG